MSDWMFASEGDSVNAGSHGPTAQADRRADGRPHRDTGDATAGVARRLQCRLDRHLWLLERMRTEPAGPEPHVLPELMETSRRMRRDTESLLLLCGRDPGVRLVGPRRLADVLDDASAAADEPRRVDVRFAPAAMVAPAASVELLHVLAELVDHLAAAYPDSRVELAPRVEPGGGVTVDVSVDGAGIGDSGGRLAAAAAELIVQRSRCGIELHHPAVGPVAAVHCPAAAVTVEGPVRQSPSMADDPFLPRPNGNGNRNGYGRAPQPASQSGGQSRPPAPVFAAAQAPAYSPSASSQVDELFGPLLDLPLEPIDDRYATPIFEAVASAWFREDAPDPGDRPRAAGRDGRSGGGGGRDPLDWETPQDREWRAAAERAARPDPTATTVGGLPRRRPGNQLVPPPLSKGPVSGATPAERVPDRVRDRLSTYQRGLREGRHRAPNADGQ